ncbi:MAG TPA: energy transducer TonB [Noviherbaspirillum sp.]
MAIHGLHPALPGVAGTAHAIHPVAVRQLGRYGPLVVVVLAHVAFFYFLQPALVEPAAAKASLHEVVVSFITPEAPAPQPAPQPAKPKTVPVVKKAISQPRRTPPPVDPTPSRQAITTPPEEPAPASSSPAAPTAAAAEVPSVPAAAPAPSVPQTITSGIEYVQPPQPEYPPVSRRMGEEGKAVLRVLVNDRGRPERADIQTSSGSARLDEAARQAVMRAVFKPFIENGKAVAAYAIVPIRFQLN